MERLKEMDTETRVNLSMLDARLNLGYDRSMIKTCEKAQRATNYSSKVEKVKRDHSSL